MPSTKGPITASEPLPFSPNARPRRVDRVSAPLQRNVIEVVLSDIQIQTWYPSFYPEDLIGRLVDRLFVCKHCFKYTTKVVPFIQHNEQCPVKAAGPPGTKIYEKDNISVYEVDGEEHKVCHCLPPSDLVLTRSSCLLSRWCSRDIGHMSPVVLIALSLRYA